MTRAERIALKSLSLPEIEAKLDAAMTATEQAEQSVVDAMNAAYEAKELEEWIRREWYRKRKREEAGE